VFGYPGATAAAWERADLDYLRAWFSADSYDLVVLEYGTNEGNASPFDPDAYRRHLGDAVRKLRSVFPSAACVLVGPGDRGVLVRRSARGRQARAALLRYSGVHESIARIQQQVAAQAGCQSWSALDAMGGPGSAYAWAKQQPPLMAPDLIHFTVRGYQRLGQAFARSLGWTEARPGAPR
jgi:lysophospholipase L1-like esterase